jgi:hypothetical protein
MQKSEIKRQQEQNKKVKAYPHPERIHNQLHS